MVCRVGRGGRGGKGAGEKEERRARKVDHRRRGGASEIEGVLDRQDAPACCFIPYNLLSHLIRPLVRGVGQRFAPMPRRGAALPDSPRAETSKGSSKCSPTHYLLTLLEILREHLPCIGWIVKFILYPRI